MTFLSLGFLLAGLAAAIPVVLHMIHRQRAKDLPFATLRFLRISVEKTRRRRRIQDLFLLLLRIAVLILIALGLAQPTLTNLSGFWGGGSSAIAIVLDNSASMGTIDAGRPRFETAMGAARQILDELEAGDQVALFLPCGPAFPEEGRLSRSQSPIRAMLESSEPPSSPEAETAPADQRGDDSQAQVRQLLAQVAPAYERADLAVKVQEARRVLAKSDASHKQIYVISDMQDLCWEGLARSEPSEEGSADGRPAAQRDADEQPTEQTRDIPIIFVDCHGQPKPNVALVDVDIKLAVPIAGVPIAAAASLYNAAAVAQQRSIELYIDGNKRYTSPSLQLEPGGRLTHDFQFSFETGGLHRCEVRLVGDDGLPLDDRRFFAMEVDQGIPVAIVKPRQHEIEYLNESYYVEQALAPTDATGWAIRTTQLTAEELISEPLSSFAVVYCVNIPAPDADTAQRLADYVQRGGNIVWIAGDNVDPLEYNAMNSAADGRLLPAPLLDVRRPSPEEDRDSWYVSQVDASHRVLAHLAEPASLYQSVLVYQHVRIDTAASPGTSVLARLDDGEPLLAQRAAGQGSVTMLGTSAHIGWTNLPVRPLFLPLLARLTFELAGAEQARHQGIAGSPLVLRFDDATRPGAMEIVPPSGGMIRRALDDDKATRADAFVYDETHEIGVYTLRPLETARTQSIAYSVNIDPDESKPKKITQDELARSFGETPLVFAEDPEDLSSTFDWLREGKSLWQFFLAGVLAFLVFECFVSNYLSPREDDTNLRQLSPGMRGLVRTAR